MHPNWPRVYLKSKTGLPQARDTQLQELGTGNSFWCLWVEALPAIVVKYAKGFCCSCRKEPLLMEGEATTLIVTSSKSQSIRSKDARKDRVKKDWDSSANIRSIPDPLFAEAMRNPAGQEMRFQNLSQRIMKKESTERVSLEVRRKAKTSSLTKHLSGEDTQLSGNKILKFKWYLGFYICVLSILKSWQLGFKWPREKGRTRVACWGNWCLKSWIKWSHGHWEGVTTSSWRT